jgi:hypothetical protein
MPFGVAVRQLNSGVGLLRVVVLTMVLERTRRRPALPIQLPESGVASRRLNRFGHVKKSR